MKKTKWVQALVGFAVVGNFLTGIAQAGETYTTSTGAVFTQVQGPQGPGGSFGLAWKDPSGTIWSSYQGMYTNNAIKPDQNNVVVDSPATEACATIGGTLPTTQQYEKLVSYFDLKNSNLGDGTFLTSNLTDQGWTDLNTLFPDMRSSYSLSLWWTSSVTSNNDPMADDFNGVPVYLFDYANSNRLCRFPVRCVAK